MHQGVPRFESGVRQSTLADEQYILNWSNSAFGHKMGLVRLRRGFETTSRQFQRQQLPPRLQRRIQARPERKVCPVSIRVSWMPKIQGYDRLLRQ